MNFLKSFLNFFGTKSKRDMKELVPLVEDIQHMSNSIISISNDELRNKTIEFKKKINDKKNEFLDKITVLRNEIKNDSNRNNQERIFKEIDELDKLKFTAINDVLNSIKAEAFAVIKETARRFSLNDSIVVNVNDSDIAFSQNREYVSVDGDYSVWNSSWRSGEVMKRWDMIHYDVQLIGGLVLHDGKIAEMQTGEGKTLVATLPIYLNALTGLGVHVVTVNDYLAKRDSEWMGPLFEFHGLSIDCIDRYKPNSLERKAAYQSDITYGTNNEFGFDYLRDNMAHDPSDIVQKDHNYAIIDEVDSVLIDDARTPLIISGAVSRDTKQEFQPLKPAIDNLVKKQRNIVNNELISAKSKLSEGNEKEGGLNLFRSFRGLPKNKGLIKFLSQDGIKTILQKTESFYMQDQSKEMHIVDDDLFFTIDEKNNSIELTDKGFEELSKFSDDSNFFILPNITEDLSKELAVSEKEEIIRNYSIKSERIHTMTQLLKAYTLFEKDVEYVVMDQKVKIVDEQTGRIMEGRRYSDGLHQAIEAKENCKIEDATQTLASISLQNYFRMYRKLSGMTGTAETEAGEFWDIYQLDVVSIPTNKPVVRQDREDYVYKTNREKYNAVVDEIVELTQDNRPVLVGTTSVEISELISRFLKRKNIRHNILNAKLHQKEADIVAEAGSSGTVTIATNMAGRGTDIKLSNEVIDSGGLAIIGTERHDSRRVDRQLRGRAGRQGDPGSSQFFVSLEDNLMRLFGSDRIAKLMDRMGLQEGEVIQHSMVTKSIERAQKKIEENNYGIRKRLLEYDDVMNSQREVIYKRRKNALLGNRLSLDISNMITDTLYAILDDPELKSGSDLRSDIIMTFSDESLVHDIDINTLHESLDDTVSNLSEKIQHNYNNKLLRIKESAYPVITNIYESRDNSYKNILIPFTDGIKTISVMCDLEKAVGDNGHSIITSFERGIMLSFIDKAWKDHLKEMDDLKQSVQGAVYEQKDPLLIYKFESFNLFKGMLEEVNKNILSFLFKSNLPQRDPKSLRSQSTMSKVLGRASRGEEEKVPSRSNSNKSQVLSRRQRREQDRKMRRD